MEHRDRPTRSVRRSRVAAAVVAASLAVLGGCSDDDGDGNREVETPDVDAPDMTTPDLDPGSGSGLPGDSGDEDPGADDTDGSGNPDLDPGDGEGLPGDEGDEGN